MAGATEKDWPKRPSDHQLHEAQKETLTGPQLLPQRARVPHPRHRQGPCRPSSCISSMLSFPGAALPQVLQAGTLERRGQHWLPYLLEHCISPCPSRKPLRTWCCQNPCDPSSCTTATPGPHRGRPKPPGQPQELNPSGRPTCRGRNKATVETQGQRG